MIETVKGIGAVILALLLTVFGLSQLYAFIDGFLYLTGIPDTTLGSTIAYVAFIILSGIFIAPIIAMYGAIVVWKWLWWQAALLCLPFTILAVAGIIYIFASTGSAYGDQRKWRSS